jgi:hypothetical protein
MATTAAVLFESSGKTIFVGMDGYPEHMVPELTRIVAADAIDTVTFHSDYMYLGEKYSEGTAKAGVPTVHGVAYREQGEPLTVTHEPFTNAPMFFDGVDLASPDHKYTVAKTGVVIAHHRY